ncbi:MAG: CRISPR-associated protein [Bacteroidales bacterium]|nr:CRISPR-associated protein [Bacteroidales bacterium]
MLINLSNHPSDSWPESQKQKAHELYQEIIDLSFPEVDPNGDEEYIENLAELYLNKIIEIKNRTSNTVIVHLMGELTFCFALVKKLQGYNIKCVASTTKRMVDTTSKNTIVKTFSFVRFREYI